MDTFGISPRFTNEKLAMMRTYTSIAPTSPKIKQTKGLTISPPQKAPHNQTTKKSKIKIINSLNSRVPGGHQGGVFEDTLLGTPDTEKEGAT